MVQKKKSDEQDVLVVRVSGYAVKFIDLTREQQLDVIARTCQDRKSTRLNSSHQ